MPSIAKASSGAAHSTIEASYKDHYHARYLILVGWWLQVKVAAAVALTNLSLNNGTNLKEFVRAGGVSPLKQLLTSGSPSARKAAQGALSQLAGGDMLPISVRPNSPDYSSDDPGILQLLEWDSTTVKYAQQCPMFPGTSFRSGEIPSFSRITKAWGST